MYRDCPAQESGTAFLAEIFADPSPVTQRMPSAHPMALAEVSPADLAGVGHFRPPHFVAKLSARCRVLHNGEKCTKKRCLEAWWPKWIALRADTRTHHPRYVCRTCHFSRLELRPVPLEPFANGLHCAPTRTHRQHCTYPPCQLAVRG